VHTCYNAKLLSVGNGGANTWWDVCRIDWRHFDAGVMKVLQQLASTAESDAVSELRQVEVTELSTVKNMPAYLNKCFNNRLWKARES
jgi:hypothetical protein